MTPPARPTICLAMIVRDEAHIIEEGLESLVDLIDRWVVVDTGSTDSTMDIVRSFFERHDVPGELHERPWIDFGTNRTQAMELAAGKGDYTWMFDADDVVVGDLDLSGLDADAHQLRFGPDLTFWRTQIFRSDQPWRYEGVLHEYPVLDGEPARIERIGGDYHVIARSAGARSKGNKSERDIEVLGAAHESDPGNPRTVFYLAQSHRDAGDPAGARRFYELRASMGGWDEEVYVSRLEMARAMAALDLPRAELQEAYLAAWASRPHRLEALCDLARERRLAGDHATANLFSSWGADAPFPEEDLLFVATDVHRWRILDEAAISAYYVGRFDDSARWCRRLLTEGHLPADQRVRVWENLAFALDALRALEGRAPWSISLLHATHRNPEQALEVRAAWLDRATHPDRVRHVFAMDDTDAASVEATVGLERVVVPVEGDGITAVANWNAAAGVATGDLLFVIADDLYPPVGWDRLLEALVGDRDPRADAFAVKVTDSPLEHDVLLRHPIVSRSFYERLGLWSPEFSGPRCDDDLTIRAHGEAVILDGRCLRLEHRHPYFDASVTPSESQRRMASDLEAERASAVYKAKWQIEDEAPLVELVDPVASSR